MKRNTMILAGAAVAAGAFWLAKRGGVVPTADAQRVAGMNQIYASSSGQLAGVDAAIRQQWQAMDSVFRGQPDFYI